jgi:hypothetical protein
MNLICFAKPFVPKQILEGQRGLRVEIKDVVDPKGTNPHSLIQLPMPFILYILYEGGE